jgi:hypothetical protein
MPELEASLPAKDFLLRTLSQVHCHVTCTLTVNSMMPPSSLFFSLLSTHFLINCQIDRKRNPKKYWQQASIVQHSYLFRAFFLLQKNGCKIQEILIALTRRLRRRQREKKSKETKMKTLQ